MTLDTLIMLAGFLVAVLPFLGFPPRWDTYIFAILGVIILGLGIIVRRRGSSAPKKSVPMFTRESVPQEPVDDGEVA